MGGNQPRRPRGGHGADKPYLAGVNEWLGGEPFPHECARGPIVDRVDQPTNVIFDLEVQLVRRPALLQGHDVRHSLATAADARDADGGPLEVRNAVILGICSCDDCPAVRSAGCCEEQVCGCGGPIQWRANVATN